MPDRARMVRAMLYGFAIAAAAAGCGGPSDSSRERGGARPKLASVNNRDAGPHTPGDPRHHLGDLTPRTGGLADGSVAQRGVAPFARHGHADVSPHASSRGEVSPRRRDSGASRGTRERAPGGARAGGSGGADRGSVQGGGLPGQPAHGRRPIGDPSNGGGRNGTANKSGGDNGGVHNDAGDNGGDNNGSAPGNRGTADGDDGDPPATVNQVDLGGSPLLCHDSGLCDEWAHVVLGDARTIGFRFTTPYRLKITRISISGDNAADFSLESGSCTIGAEIDGKGESCTVRITFAPTAVGLRTAMLSIEHEPGDPTIQPLQGGGESPRTLTQP